MATTHPVPPEWAARAYVTADSYAAKYDAALASPEHGCRTFNFASMRADRPREAISRSKAMR